MDKVDTNKLKHNICSRKVSEESFEKKDMRKIYWKGKIKNMERSIVIPHSHRKQYVKNVISSDVYDAVSNVLYFENDDTVDTKLPSSMDESINSKIMNRTTDDRSKTLDLEMYEEETVVSDHKLKVNPYINFLKKSPEEANIWMPKKPPDFRIKPLIEKSAIITHNIINDFIEWLKTLGPINSDISLNENTLQKMFRIGINEFAIKSLCIDVKEIGSVPWAVANACQNPQTSTRRVLQTNLARDIKAEKLKKHTYAFGTALPVELQKFPPKNDTYNRWIKCLHVPEELKTMEYVFRDITEISSVKRYCQWLIEHPYLSRPKYLVDLGLLNPKYWKQCLSIDTRELEVLIDSTLRKEFSSGSKHADTKSNVTFEESCNS